MVLRGGVGLPRVAIFALAGDINAVRETFSGAFAASIVATVFWSPVYLLAFPKRGVLLKVLCWGSFVLAVLAILMAALGRVAPAEWGGGRARGPSPVFPC